MTTYSYTANIPNAPNNPSNDQPIMQTNSQSINSYVQVDHTPFDLSGSNRGAGGSAGQHKQVTFNLKNPPGGAPTDPLSIMYTNNIAASGMYNSASASTNAEVFFQNASATFPVSMIKAFGCFSTAATPAAPTLLNGYNIAPDAVNPHPNKGIFTLTMPTGVCNSVNYLVFVSSTTFQGTDNGNIISYNYTIIDAANFNLSFATISNSTFSDPVQFSVMVMQL